MFCMASTSGLSSFSMKSLAYVDNDSMNLHCPSAKIVSKARDDFPEPETLLLLLLYCEVYVELYF